MCKYFSILIYNIEYFTGINKVFLMNISGNVRFLNTSYAINQLSTFALQKDLILDCITIIFYIIV
jgi:hypothetical protein